MAIPGILGRIVERTREDVEARRSRVSRQELEDRARVATRRDFEAALRRENREKPVRMICEIKKASPSRGVFLEDLDPAALAASYRENGAEALSVVTEPHFFLGEDGFLSLARSEADALPILRKDFHVDELQILEAAAGNADAVLLIASVLSPVQLKDYLDMAGELGLGHLVEVGDGREAETVLRSGAQVVGVNNRDLTTFEVDVKRTEAVLPLLRESDVVSVSESGIRERDTVLRLSDGGIHALLVGESLVVAPDPGAKLRELRGVGDD